MKKLIALPIFLMFTFIVSAQVNLDFAVNIDDKIYQPNDKLKVEINVINREVSFAAKNAILTLTIADREYSFKLGDLSAGKSFSKEINLPEFPPGTHTIKGVLNYTGIFDEISTVETYNAFEVSYPEIERYPRNVNVVGFNLPDKMIAGKTYDVSVIVKNEGTIGGNMIIEVASLEESTDVEVFLGPGESKTVTLKVVFKNTEVSLIEARVYSLIDGQRYLLVYSGKKTYLEPERESKLTFEKLDFVDEADNQLNNEDTAKIKIFLKNEGYIATNVKSVLTSSDNEITVVDSEVNYETIVQGSSYAPNEDTFTVKTDKTLSGEKKLTLKVTYIDSENREKIIEVPIKVIEGQERCNKAEDCPSDSACSNNKCKKVTCECGEIINKQCVQYGCCTNTDCGEYDICDLSIKKCVASQQCVEVLKNGNPDDKIDVLFVGDGYTSYAELKKKSLELIDANNNGLFSVDPFKTNKNSFNVWMITAADFKHQPTSDQWGGQNSMAPAESGQRYVATCPFIDNSVVISKEANYRSYAYFGGTAYLSLSAYSSNMQGRLLLHEFGHSFGYLRDEYVEGTRNNAGPPNCAPTKSEGSSWWGDLAQLDKKVGFYEGCSYLQGNFRPTQNSIMRNHQDLTTDYEMVNERALEAKIRQRAGIANNAQFSSDYPIIFLHGWSGDTTTFQNMQQKFEDDKITRNMDSLTTRSTSLTACPEQDWAKPISVNFEYYSQNQGWIGSEDAGIEEYGKRLSKAVKLVKYCTKSDKVILIAHSMGGLVARSFMLDFGTQDIQKLITLATPHYGAELGDNGKDALEMEPNNAFLLKLNSMDCGNRPLIVPIATTNDFEEINPSKKQSQFEDSCISEAKAGDWVVSEGSAKLKTGKESYIVKCGHTGSDGIVNPKGCSDAYNIVKGEIE